MVAGYYINQIILHDPRFLQKVLNIALLTVVLGIGFQMIVAGPESVFLDRLYGLNGEPKYLALYLVPFFMAFLAANKNKNSNTVALALILSAIVLTRSATGLAALLFMTIIYFFHVSRYGSMRSWRPLITMLVLMSAATVIIMATDLKLWLVDRFFIYAAGNFIPGVQAVIKMPILGLLTVEANDAPVLMFLMDHPLAIISGVGLGQESAYSYRYLLDAGGIGFLGDDYTGYITPNSALISNIANYGLFALLFLGWFAVKAIRSINCFDNSSLFFIKWFFISHYLISLFIFKTAIPMPLSLVVLVGMISSSKSVPQSFVAGKVNLS